MITATRLYGNKRDSLKSRPKEPLYIAGEDLDFSWYRWQLNAIKEDYDAGIPLMEIANRQGRDYREVTFLVMEMAHMGEIIPRDSGIF
ncbi:MAG: hypothetical protein GX369_08345 [Euryarchaeota archaeon]|nr:hypothetical protein [Euryarchaeota archaeon]